MADIEVILEVGATVEAEIVATGRPGHGVPTGGEEGQVLVKTGSEDYATAWGQGTISASDDGEGNVTLFFEVSNNE